MEMTQNEIEVLSKKNPGELIARVRAGLDQVSLTFALEALGQVKNNEAFELLVSNLTHSSSLVREGAIMGLLGHEDKRAIKYLKPLAQNDSNSTIKQFAQEAIDELEYESE